MIAEVSGPGGATGFGIYLLVVGSGLAAACIVSGWRDLRSRLWPTVVGTVQRTWIDDDEGQSVEVEVAYVVRGRLHVREETVVEKTSFRETREAMLKRLRPGTPVVVHHHPTRPQVSRLRTGLRWRAALFGAIGVAMAVGGVAMLTGVTG